MGCFSVVIIYIYIYIYATFQGDWKIFRCCTFSFVMIRKIYDFLIKITVIGTYRNHELKLILSNTRYES